MARRNERVLRAIFLCSARERTHRAILGHIDVSSLIGALGGLGANAPARVAWR